MGPFNLPWSTFLAYVVIGASVGIAVLWAVLDKKKEGGE